MNRERKRAVIAAIERFQHMVKKLIGRDNEAPANLDLRITRSHDEIFVEAGLGNEVAFVRSALPDIPFHAKCGSLKIDGDNCQSLTSLGAAFFETTKTDAAIKFANDATPADPAGPDAFADLGK